MNLKNLVTILLVGLMVQLEAYSNTLKNSTSWQVDLATIKNDIATGTTDVKIPLLHKGIVNGDSKSQILTYDVSNIDDISLIVSRSMGGSGFGAFLNPVLTDIAGNSVSLTSLEPTYAKSAVDKPWFDEDVAKKTLKYKNKTYSTGIVIPHNGRVDYNLNKKYKILTVEVAVIFASKPYAAIVDFKIQDKRFDPEYLFKQLSKENQQAINAYIGACKTNFNALFLNVDGKIESGFINNIITDLEDKSFFEYEIKSYNTLPSLEKLIKLTQLTNIALETKKLYDLFQWVNVEALDLYWNDIAKTEGFDIKTNKPKFEKIKVLYPGTKKGILHNDAKSVLNAKEILKLNKELLLANPLLDVDKIVVSRYKLGRADRTAMGPAIGTPQNNWASLISTQREGFDAEIAELSNLRGDVKVRTIYEPKDSRSITDLRLNWNADKLLFGSSINNRWKVFEIGVDGTGLTEVIDCEEPDAEFMDANYLPDGRILATSNLGYQAVPCVSGADAVVNLVQYNRETKDLRRLTFDQDANWSPVIMNNGRVMYTRWEYTDLTHYFSRFIMHMNPDGTENKALYGSGSFWPTSMYDAYPLPGQSAQFVCIVSGHHGVARSGRLFIFDPLKSRKEEHGVVQELPFKDVETIPEIKDELVDGVWPQFIRPYPISDKYFLVSAKMNEGGLWGVYLIDVFDNMTCIAEFEGEGFNTPMLIEKRPTPPVIPDRVDLTKKDATIFIQDIYAGEGSIGLPRGTVKELRIFAYEFAYHKTESDHDSQGIQSGWDLKRLLGTVPVEEDGSIIFTAPSNTPLSLQPVGYDGGAVQWMRSWVTAMPGETVSCIGCHEDQNQIPIPKRTIASKRKPHAIKTPEGGVRSFTFDLEIQPILNRACIACHDSKSSLSFVRELDPGSMRRVLVPLSKSYLNFMPYIYRQGPEADMYVLEPYEYHATNSELVRILKRGHYGVELTDKEWRSIYNWVDFNAPYHGQYFNISDHYGYNQYERRIELAKKYGDGVGVDWRKEIADYSEFLKAKGEIKAEMPKKPKEIKAKKLKISNWPMTTQEAKALQAEKGTIKKIIEIAPDVKMNFVWVPAGEFAMGSNNSWRDVAPAFKAKVQEGFWMSECEVTNEQYNVLVPSHDSRVIGQFWKDHTTAGYWANLPQQPVIRISSEEAQNFCEQLGIKTGVTMSLPTETQWEWACRAGSEEAFWYGNLNSDFGKKENLADTNLSDMAVIGVDPKPMAANDPLRKYWDYLPKESSVNDGSMIQTTVGSYEANAWGLKDMHGNVAEWTLSDYRPYPLNKKTNEVATQVVARGGSWTDRPKESTSYVRKAYLPWQMAYNVGFRIIITE